MKKIAFRAHIGNWIYYLTSMRFDEVNTYVQIIDDQFHKSKSLSDMIQRAITKNSDKITQYIQKQNELFFNSLVLAVYDGDPQWKEITFSSFEIDDMSLGFLEFNGREKIFAVDGQHRVSGIKKAIIEDPDDKQLKENMISVIFIGHRNTPEGIQRTRRLFTTLNRYAKPVALSEIIALDEDDTVAIGTRYLISNNMLFKDERLNTAKQKAINANEKKAFTNIISLYQCNLEILYIFLENLIVKNNNGRVLKGKSKVDYFLRFRPEEQVVNEYIQIISKFWDSFATHIQDVRDYLSLPIEHNPASYYRNAEGGSILFRPIGLIPFVQTAISDYKKIGDWDIVFQRLNCLPLSLSVFPWEKLIWNPLSKKMIVRGRSNLVRFILDYLSDQSGFNQSKLINLCEQYHYAIQDEDGIDLINELNKIKVPPTLEAE